MSQAQQGAMDLHGMKPLQDANILHGQGLFLS